MEMHTEMRTGRSLTVPFPGSFFQTTKRRLYSASMMVSTTDHTHAVYGSDRELQCQPLQGGGRLGLLLLSVKGAAYI
jgi:hypothetical protein